MESIFSSDMANAISLTVLHSLWQGVMIGLVLWLALRVAPIANVRLRYHLSLMALMLLLVSGICTFLYFSNVAQNATLSFEGSWYEISNLLYTTGSDQYEQEILFASFRPLVFIVWITGVLVLSLRLLLNFLHLKFIAQKRNTHENVFLSRLLEECKNRWNSSKNISVYESSYVSSPVSFGWFRSIILLPIGILNQLEVQEIEAILDHEIGHILRNDFIVNLGQSLIETLFYYHPVVWWISRNIKNERELCCDQFALKYFDDMQYAKILVKLQELSWQKPPVLAMPLSTNAHTLSNRIKRILNMKQSKVNFKTKLLTTILVLSLFVIFSFTIKNDRWVNEMEPLMNAAEIAPLALDETALTLNRLVEDTIPKSVEKQIDIRIKKNDEEVELEMNEEGIQRLSIDGRKIPKSEYVEHQELIDRLTNRLDQLNIDEENDQMQLYFGGNYQELLEGKSEEFAEMFENLEHLEDWHIQHYNFPQLDENSNVWIFPDEALASAFDWEEGDGPEEFKQKIKEFQKSVKRKFKDYEFEFPQGLNFEEDIEKSLAEAMEKIHEGNFEIHKLEHDKNFQKLKDLENLRPFDFHNDLPLNFNHNNFTNRNSSYSKLHKELNRDGLLEIGKLNKIELTKKHLKINRDKMPRNIHQKYLRLYEKLTGFPLTGKTKLEFELQGQESRRLRTI